MHSASRAGCAGKINKGLHYTRVRYGTLTTMIHCCGVGALVGRSSGTETATRGVKGADADAHGGEASATAASASTGRLQAESEAAGEKEQAAEHVRRATLLRYETLWQVLTLALALTLTKRGIFLISRVPRNRAMLGPSELFLDSE